MNGIDKLLQVITNKHVFIQTHNYPDQDALASAYGLKAILAHYNIDSTICYEGLIDKYNTQKMVELLKIDICPLNEIGVTSEDEIIIVDGQKGNTNMLEVQAMRVSCIDHHSLQDTSCYSYYDIRSEVGACSSIIASYIVENNIEISKEVATALLYGIKIDTMELTRKVSDLDLDMFYYLFKKADRKVLKKIESNNIKRSDLESYKKAIQNLEVYDGIGIANIGNNCSEAMMGTVSDLLITLSEVNFTLVYSYRAGGIKLSVRSILDSVDASEVIKVALLRIGDGGGHPSMAAGFIPNIAKEETAMKVIELVEQRVIKLVGEYKKNKANEII
ncbi:DHH family phosphoesterase [Anaeromicropila herbilytica]|uniref:DHH family phosphoesterase n=1 Tax=Anaeromicropila herbilytica TaxID=2785025 RepID=A0A7R7EHQ1_9FIRM|nr:DHH family phosphoesterase [Anaeromicropila herbilytica]BCN28933.1 DHH family phosphoesterase [Anaeromicropila herbilytica]